MLTMMEIGFLLFWVGFVLAYPGTMWVPAQANSLKMAVRLLALTAISGWVAILIAYGVFDYGRTWLAMPAAYIFGGLAVICGVVIIWIKPREKR